MFTIFIFILGLLVLIQTVLELKDNKRVEVPFDTEEEHEQTPQSSDKILNDISAKLVRLNESIKNNIESINNIDKLNEMQKFLEKIYNISNNNYKLSVNLENIELDLRRVFVKLNDLNLLISNNNDLIKNCGNVNVSGEESAENTEQKDSEDINTNEEELTLGEDNNQVVVEDKKEEIGNTKNNDELSKDLQANQQPVDELEENPIMEERKEIKEVLTENINEEKPVDELEELGELNFTPIEEVVNSAEEVDNTDIRKNVDLDIIKEKINSLKDKLQIKNPDDKEEE